MSKYKLFFVLFLILLFNNSTLNLNHLILGQDTAEDTEKRYMEKN